MATLQKLERENEKLRNIILGRKEEKEIGRKRKQLKNQNKKLRFQVKYPSLVNFVNVTSKGTARVAKVGSKYTVKGFKKIRKYADDLEVQEKKKYPKRK